MNNITITVVNSEQFSNYQELFQTENFLQTGFYLDFQHLRQKFLKTEALLFSQEDQIIGGSIVLYRKRKYFFTEAFILHGPLMNYDNPTVAMAVFEALDNYMRTNKVSSLIISPYLVDKVRDSNLNTLSENLANDTKNVLASLQFKKLEGSNYQMDYVTQIFRKEIASFSDSQELFNSFERVLKKDIRKFEKFGIYFQKNNIENFYELEKATAERRHFTVQSLDYFQDLIEAFDGKMFTVSAMLDIDKYISAISDRITELEQQLSSITDHSIKANKRKKELETLISSSKKRIIDIKKMNVSNQKIANMASILFVDSKNERVSYLGGNDYNFVNLGGYTLLNWYGMKEAYELGKKYYNFYGTMEENNTDNTGNFQYKKNFNGELINLIGVYKKHYNPIFKLLDKD